MVADTRLALSGTPVENSLSELWSLFEFINPGLLGDAEWFAHRYTRPIEREGRSEPLVQLRAQVVDQVVDAGREHDRRALPGFDRRVTDPGARGQQLIQPLERERQMRAALGGGDRVHLVDDDRLHRRE